MVGLLLLVCGAILLFFFCHASSELGCVHCHNTKKIDAFSGSEWFEMTCPHCKVIN